MKKNTEINSNKKLITRKQAIKKAGVTALTAASLVFLQTKAHAQDSFKKAEGVGEKRKPSSER